MKDNSLIVIVLVILVIVGCGFLLMDRRTHEHIWRKSEIVVPVMPAPQSYPYYSPEFHSNQHFWAGYNDGWSGLGHRLTTPEYNRGYEIGVYDRRKNNHYYYDHYLPPGFVLRLPGFRLDIR